MRKLSPLSGLLAIAIIFSLLPAAWITWNQWGHSYFISPRAWPQKTITYYNQSGWQRTLDLAARQWNRLDFGHRLIETDSADDADIIIIRGLAGHCDSCRGHASQIGYQPYGQAEIYLEPPTESDSSRAPDLHYVGTIAHEFGHVLGLTHEDTDCSLMHSGGRYCKELAIKTSWTDAGMREDCGPYANDLRRLENLYDIERPLEEQPWCLDPTLKPPGLIIVAGQSQSINCLFGIINRTCSAKASS